MKKWYVEYKTPASHGWQGINDIEAKDGKQAIEYVKSHVIGAYKFKAFHDDEEEEQA